MKAGDRVYFVEDPATVGVVRCVEGKDARVVWQDDPKKSPGLWYAKEKLRPVKGGKRKRNPPAVPAPEVQDLEFTTRLHPETRTVVVERDEDYRGDDNPGPVIMESAEIFELFQDMGTLDQEHIVIGLLDTRHQLVGWKMAHKGTLDNVSAAARDMLKDALLTNSRAVFLIHNHPTGDPDPSDADADLTEAVERLAAEYEIYLFDHVVIGRTGLDPMTREDRFPYYSFRDDGKLAPLEDPEEDD